MANFLPSSNLKTDFRCRTRLSHNAFLYEGHFWAEKRDKQQGRKNFLCSQTFCNLGRIYARDLWIQHAKFGCPTLTRCRELAAQSFENLAKGGPRQIFGPDKKFDLLKKLPDLVANFLLSSNLKMDFRCRTRSFPQCIFV